MSYGYANRNPYDQRQGGAQPGYGAPSPQYGGYSNGPAMGRGDYDGTNVEMEPLTGTGSSFPREQDPKAILNECRDVDRGIEEIKEVIKTIQSIQATILSAPDSTSATSQLTNATSQLMAMYRNLTGRVKNIKQKPESGSPRNAPHVRKVDHDLKETLETYRKVDSDFGRAFRDQYARQYRIVHPEASEAEAQLAANNPDGQMFAQAIMQSDRRGQSQTARNAVEQRHAAIEKIAQQMAELADLFQDMDNLVVQQEAAVTNIEMKGEEVVDNMGKGTEQIGVAVKSARNARKWKWWCLGIVVLIIIIIVVVVLIYKFVIQTPVKTAKRFVLTDSIPAIKLSTSGRAVVLGQDFKSSSKMVVPGVEWKGDELVVPGMEYVPGSRKSKRFEA